MTGGEVESVSGVVVRKSILLFRFRTPDSNRFWSLNQLNESIQRREIGTRDLQFTYSWSAAPEQKCCRYQPEIDTLAEERSKGRVCFGE